MRAITAGTLIHYMTLGIKTRMRTLMRRLRTATTAECNATSTN
jgi:hypothetical protein